MKLKLEQHPKNLFPKGAVLVKSDAPRIWLQEIQNLGFELNEIKVYAVPSLIANQLYGCLIVYKQIGKGINIGRHRYFQNCNDVVFLPENTVLSPFLFHEEWETVFSKHPHILHPDFGLVELSEPVNWLEILTGFTENYPALKIPLKGIMIPHQITSLQIEVNQEAILHELANPISEEELLDKLPFDMKKVLKGNQKEIDKYLLFLDQNPEMALKYAIPLDVLNTSRGSLDGRFTLGKSFGSKFRNFFSKIKRPRKTAYSGGGGGPFSNSTMGKEESWFGYGKTKLIFRIFVFIFICGRVFSASSGVILGFLKVLLYGGILIAVLYFIYKYFKEREEKEVDPKKTTSYPYQGSTTSVPSSSVDVYKLLPVAVVVAIVIMSFLFVKFLTSSSVDQTVSPFFYIMAFLLLLFVIVYLLVRLADKLDDSLQQNNRAYGSVVLLDNDRFSTLRVRYEKLAQDFIDKKEYQKASHVYRRLLQNNDAASEVLERGALYQEAAVSYLKLCQNKEKASECFEKGRSYKQAIEIYKELHQKEKVGDLYLLMHQRNNANIYFNEVVEEYKANSQYVKASLILRKKVKDTSSAQSMLLKGWRANHDAINCLNNYFANISEMTELQKEIQTIYEEETSEENRESFLQLLKIEFKKDEALQEVTRDIAYEIIASKIEKKPSISSELVHFNRENTSLSKDIMKYKLNKKSQT